LKTTFASSRFALAFAAVAAASLAPARTARAAVTAVCYVNMGRVVDAAPLSGTMRQTTETLGGLNYYQYLPLGHDPAKKWPVIVFMHGSGESSDMGPMINLTKHSLPRLVEDPSWDWPFIVISPQIDSKSGWLSHASEVSAVLDKVISTYGGDPNRLYLTGLSMGGEGTYTVGIALANRWAAIMPVTPGDSSPSNWDQRAAIIDMPIWQFHGTLDTEYMANVTDSMQLETSGAAPFFRYDYAFTDEYNDVVPKQTLGELHNFGSYEMIMHDVWYAAYGTFCTTPAKDATKTTQYIWLLSHSKDGSAYVDPRGASGIDGGTIMAADSGATVAGDAGAPEDASSTGAAGGGGTAGTTGAGGSTGAAGGGGTAGTTGAGGTTGAAGATSGTAGTTGAAGSSTGAAGMTAGTSGTGAAGTSGGGAKASSGCAIGEAAGSPSTLGAALAAVALALARRRRRG
jgi:MYXO-CTERM domain-containing protein